MREAQLLVTGNAALPEFKSMAADTDSTVSRLLVNSRPFCEPFPLKTDPTTVQQYKRLYASILGNRGLAKSRSVLVALPTVDDLQARLNDVIFACIMPVFCLYVYI